MDPELKEILAKRKIFLKRYFLLSLSPSFSPNSPSFLSPSPPPSPSLSHTPHCHYPSLLSHHRSLRFCSSSSESEEEELKLKALLPNMEICGAIEFKMDKKSYRMIPLAKSEDYLYNRQSLKKARMVSQSGHGVYTVCTVRACTTSIALHKYM